MAANQPPWPREWLMTDERIGELLWRAIGRLPVGGGIVFRHYSTPPEERARLGQQVAEICQERELVLSVARDILLAERLGARLVHKPDEPSGLNFSMSVHDAGEAEAARTAGASLAFVAPVHRTRSHPEGRALGLERAAELALRCGCPAIALGGMDSERFAELDAAFPGRFHGYAGIDCWLR
ncbi:MAG TPA: thiamine phosphate synthase [Sphingomicrobium sp.]